MAKWKVLCCGDRNWNDWKPINSVLEELKSPTRDIVVIHGKARGADSMCGFIANKLGYEVKEYKADWEQYGKAAGPIRNRQMLQEHKTDEPIQEVIAFHDDIEQSKGTKNMIEQAQKHGIRVRLITSDSY